MLFLIAPLDAYTFVHVVNVYNFDEKLQVDVANMAQVVVATSRVERLPIMQNKINVQSTASAHAYVATVHRG